MAPGLRLALTLASLPALAQQITGGSRTYLGTVTAVIQDLSGEGGTPGLRVKQGSANVRIRHVQNRDGRVSISGVSAESENSTFVLKGTASELHGYLVNYDAGRAWRYGTDAAGKVYEEEVSLGTIVPCLDPSWLQATNGHFAAAAATAIHPTYSAMALRQAPHIGPYDNRDVTKLESRPGSPYVFYLNISAVMSGDTPLNGVTKENMYRMWQGVADHYSAYNLNITTNPAVYNAAKAADVTKTGIITFVNQDGRSNAPVGSFGTTSAGTMYRNPASGFDYGYGIGMTAAHEVGHEMGMNHDHGGAGGEYFEGIAAYQWGPIMGNYWMGANWANAFWTWSKGEYDTATNFEDDLRIMNVSEGVPYLVDDNPSGKALILGASGAINPTDNFGQIERTGDTDIFTFSLSSDGKLNLRIDPIEYLHMLDVDAAITTAAGTPVAHSNLGVNRSAEFVDLALGAGDYRLIIMGGAEGTPQNGFSNYSSLGWYAMQGTLTGAGASAPAITQQPKAVSVAVGQTATFSVTASGAAPLSYQWRKNGMNLAGATSAAYTTPTATAGDNGAAFSVVVSNSLGSVTSTNAVLTVTSNPGTEALTNGTFESGATGWTGTTGAIGNWNSYNEPAYAGSNAVYFGGNDATATETLYQQVAIPSNAASATLTFQLHIDTAETTTSTAYDKLVVQVQNSSGTVLGTLATYSNLNKAAGYQLRTFDLSAYKGQTVRVYFKMTEDASLQTSFLVDNVSLMVK